MKPFLRRAFCLTILIAASYQSFAQIGQTRRTTSAFPMTECDATGAPVAGAVVEPAPLNAAFRIWNVDTNGNPIIYFLEWKHGNAVTDTVLFDLYNYALAKGARSNKAVMPAIATPGNRKYFLVDAKYLADTLSVRLHPTWTNSTSFIIGTVTMPIKVRLSDFDFGANLSLGPTFGFRMRTSRFKDRHMAFLGSLNIGVVDVDSFSSKGTISGQPVKNVGVFSPAAGVMFEVDRAQAGIFLGVDLMSRYNNINYNWIYQGKPWLSLGFGYSLFSKNGSDESSASTEQRKSK